MSFFNKSCDCIILFEKQTEALSDFTFSFNSGNLKTNPWCYYKSNQEKRLS